MIAAHLPGWFEEPGAYVLVDGQFGSTGKGLMAGFLAEQGREKITHVTTNAGPNSGHTAYFMEPASEPVVTIALDQRSAVVAETVSPTRVMTQQLPVASVFLRRMGHNPVTLLNAGAVIDPKILLRECNDYGFRGEKDLSIHPNAAVITEADVRLDQITVAGIAGTGKGIGPALANKIMRHHGQIAADYYQPMLPAGMRSDRGWDQPWDWSRDVVFVETAQGFSLGVNSHRFYPNVTSRECTVMQACADARIPASRVKKVIACYRTFPIRVGNTEASSGDCYEDQRETTWEALGLTPELTTVTKRVRRVFTWSRIQFRESVAANEPDVIFLNFVNYLEPYPFQERVQTIIDDYRAVLDRDPMVLFSRGPYSHNIHRWA